MEMINLFDAAIFDMDGTILDSLGVWDKIDYDFLEKKRGIKVPDDYAETVCSMSFREIADYTISRFSLSDTPKALMDEWTRMAEYEYANNIKIKKSVREYISYLKENGKKIVLCTSSPICFYEPAMKNNDIYHLFDAFTTSCEAGAGKASPAVYLLAASKVNVQPERCMVFEDIMSAARSAKKAGMMVCGVFDERSKAYVGEMKKLCDYYINSFEELL